MQGMDWMDKMVGGARTRANSPSFRKAIGMASGKA
jgi:hypothetical protein